jgi:hypothetical protein
LTSHCGNSSKSKHILYSILIFFSFFSLLFFVSLFKVNQLLMKTLSSLT